MNNGVERIELYSPAKWFNCLYGDKMIGNGIRENNLRLERY